MNSRIQKLSENRIGNDYVVGDLHGYYTILMNKLKEINFNFEKDRLFSVGDLIDRGNENVECLELMYEKWFYPVVGNHEILFYRALILDDFNLWYKNGGHWYEIYKNEKNTFLEYVKDMEELLPMAIEINGKNKKIGIVHAEPFEDWNKVNTYLKDKFSLENLIYKELYKSDDFWYNTQKLIWSRNKIKNNNKKYIKNIDKVYVGHTIVKKRCKLGNVVYIDKGVYKTGDIHIEKIKY